MRRLKAVGLRPFSEHPQVKVLISTGMNIVGETIPPEGLDSIMALRFVVAIEPAP